MYILWLGQFIHDLFIQKYETEFLKWFLLLKNDF